MSKKENVLKNKTKYMHALVPHVKVLLSVIIITLLILLFFISLNLFNTRENLGKIINNYKYALEIKEINLTGLITGEDVAHEHVYEKKHSTTQHWEECWMCKNKINIVNHNILTRGVDSCRAGDGYVTEYCQAGCGYTKQLPKKAHTEGTLSSRNRYFRHVNACTVCGTHIVTDRCKEKNGNIIGCDTGNWGECVGCGFNYTPKHAHIFGQTSNWKSSNIENGVGKCNVCSKEMFTYTCTRVINGESTVSFNWHVVPTDPNINILSDSRKLAATNTSFSTPPTFSMSANKNSDGTIDASINVDSSKITAAVNFGACIYVNYTYMGLAGNEAILIASSKTDYYAPTAKSITATGTGAVGTFSKKATITATFTEGWDSVVQIALYDSSGKVISNWGAATNNGDGTFTRQMDIVAGVKDAETFTVKAKDRLGNIGEGTVQVQYIDTAAPTLVSGTSFMDTWTTSKQITFTLEDKGSQEVQISFNDHKDYVLGEYSNGKYSRTYKFVGDVYDYVEGALYAKDALGNTSTTRVKIGKIDNTAPTIQSLNKIPNANKTGVTIKTVANDYNSVVKAEGSGIAGYAITQNLTEPSTYQVSDNFNVTANGTYYVWAKDNVGYVTNKSVTVTEIDTIKPNVTLVADKIEWTSEDVNITWNLTDTGGSNIKNIKLPDGTYGTGASGIYTASTNGTYTFVGYDNAGNSITKTITVSNIDKIKPKIKLIIKNPEMNNTKTIITWEIEETESGVKETVLPNGEITTQTQGEIVAMENGEYTVIATDKVGNTTIQKIEVTNIDKTPPTLILETEVKEITNENIYIKWKTEDNKSGVKEVVLPDGNIESKNTGKFNITENGIYTFLAYDKLGNERIEKIEITNIDNVKPKLKLTIKKRTEKTIELEWTAFDNESGIKGIILPDGTISEETKGTKTFALRGQYTFIAVDNARNETKETIYIK